MTAALVRPANGSAVDVEALYRDQRPGLVRYATKIAGGRPEAGEDAVQEAFARMLADPDKVRKPAAYVAGRARYGALDESAHRRRQTPVGEAMDWQPDTSPPVHEGGGTAPCMGDPATVAKVHAALDTLPEADRRAVRLHFLDGMPVSAVAQHLGVSRPAIYQRINRSLARLAALGVTLDDDPAGTVDTAAGAEAGGDAPASGAPGDEMPAATRARVDAALALLARVAPGRRVTFDDVKEILREHGLGRTSRVVAAAVRGHNDPLPASAPRYLDRRDGRPAVDPSQHKPSTAAAVRKPHVLRAAAHLRDTYGATPPEDLPRVSELARIHGWDASTASYARSAYIEGLDLQSPKSPPAPTRAGGDGRAAGDVPPTRERGAVKVPARRPRHDEVASVEDLAATLDREYPGRWISSDVAAAALRRVYGTCSKLRARRAQAIHNTPYEPGGAPPPAAERPEVTEPAATPAPASAQVVAEVWLLGARPPIRCLLVHDDETTGHADLTAVSMPGAQREITGQLIGQGYRPDGPWVDVDPDGPEAMRKFKPAEGV